MGFWTIMLIMDLLIPLIMVFYGYSFYKKFPKRINRFFGYRTFRSMKNEDTWIFAHHFFGKIAFIIGLVLLPVTFILMLFFKNKGEEAVGMAGTLVMTGQVVFLIIPIIPTEIALRIKFDRHGNRRVDL